MNKHIQGGPKK